MDGSCLEVCSETFPFSSQCIWIRANFMLRHMFSKQYHVIAMFLNPPNYVLGKSDSIFSW